MGILHESNSGRQQLQWDLTAGRYRLICTVGTAAVTVNIIMKQVRKYPY
jgi:hypothetical protein